MKVPSIFRVPDSAKLEATLGVPSGFLAELVEEGDWSFVVKSHALLEAALAELLAQKGEPRLGKFFRRLPFAGNRNSKLAVARDLGLIDEHVASFLAVFAKLRNNLVHDASLVRFTLEEYVSKMDEAALRSTADAFGGVLDELRGAEAVEARRVLAQLHFRYIVYFAVMASLAQMHFTVYPADLAEVELRWSQADQSKWAGALILLVLLAAVAQSKGEPHPD